MNIDTGTGTAVRIERLSAGYGRQAVLRDISLAIEPGELVSLLGPSGCGKSTLLRVVAGLHAPTQGEIRFNDRVVMGLPAERRGAAMVFQKPLLFPYLTVGGNVAFGLKMRGMGRAEIRERVASALRLVQLEGYENRHPGEISGGQEQRVALARALVTEPQLLLLDEPFSALDLNLRSEMQRLVREIQQQLRMTTIFVTHDQTEAARLADRVALLLDGELVQFDRPRQFYTAPASPAVARFFGWQLLTLEATLVAIRPEQIRLYAERDWPAQQAAPLVGRLSAVTDLGWQLASRVELPDGGSIETLEPSGTASRLTVGERVILDFPPAALRRFGSA